MYRCFLPILILAFSCSDKKEIKMTSFNLTEKEITACFNQKMNSNTFFEIYYTFKLKDGTKLNVHNGNSYFNSVYPSYFKNNTDSCYSHDKTDWEDPNVVERHIGPEIKEYEFYRNLRTEDILEIKYVVFEHPFDTLNIGAFYPNK
jgi:hypothetical protein